MFVSDRSWLATVPVAGTSFQFDDRRPVPCRARTEAKNAGTVSLERRKKKSPRFDPHQLASSFDDVLVVQLNRDGCFQPTSQSRYVNLRRIRVEN